ncbi:ABC transporter transmembrane domain-containing protein [Aneurinibacillus aneurinilyticus]|uniref:ABC transporter transmembrane domain-containing protein n=1 Tax=Aneurinibacillus aneurinilyticus TaxID=1391 RepID=UPI002E1E1D2A|nr:ABC transporter transmembrane domain-containing protein [Aneurinibacillus aneurinilyticus]MED0671455.1 ABC transporter transmembrane domain-containing protein [Aneurinibacillus aneurinilyticus]
MLTVIKNLLGYIRPYKLLTSLFFFTLLLDLAFVSLAPLSFKFIIDKAIEPRDIDTFFLILQVLVISGLICLSSGIVSDYVLAKLNARVQTDLRRKLFVQMQHLNISFFQKARSGDLVSYFSIDLPAIEGAMTSILTTGIQSLSVVVISTVVLFYLQWSMAIFILVGATVIFAGPYLLGRRAQKINAMYKEQLTSMTSDIQENLKAQKVIKGFNLQTAMIDKFNVRLKSLFISSYSKNVMNAQLERIPMISLLLINFTIIGFGSYLALKGHITVGSLVAFFTMYTSMGNSVFNLTFTIPAFTEALVSMERIGQLLNQPREETGGSESAQLKQRHLGIQVDNVTFGYHAKQPVLKQINMNIPACTTVAFVGSSGSGKSTMVQLLLGFYEPDKGHIRINGSSLRALDRSLYRGQISVVFQDNFLFQGTLLENIRISKPDASLDKVIEASKKAEIHDYICTLPDGYETQVLDEGGNFSGGQRQRLAIARAILRDPPILLLDEATSALDPISEASINQTFEKLSHDRTVIIVTHRLASITGADHIFVFDQGELVDSGNHLQLLEKDGFYKKLWDKQSGLAISHSGQEASIDNKRLSRLPFFRGVNLDVLKEISNLFTTETFAAKQTVIHEGEPGEKFYLIVRGKVEVTKWTPHADKQISLAVLEDGDHFGEIALLENVPRTATVTAMTPCVFLTLQRKVLYYILSKYPEINALVRQTLQERRK